jgi:FAD/FMN-containing dehydrogenase
VVTVFTKTHNTIGLMSISPLKQLSDTLEGSLLFDDLHKTLYATDASAYRISFSCGLPKSEADIVKLIHFANQHKISLIPRTAGTSLAGQTVGRNVVDVSNILLRS